MDALMQEKASSLKLAAWHDDQYLHIQIQPPESADLPPTDLVAILDISGSMDTEALVKNKEGIKETQGLTILSVLKHAVKTTIYNLSQKDRFGLVSFSDYGCVEYELDYMNQQQQKIASDVLEKLETEGSTNLWAGLFEGLEVLRKKYQPNRQASLILLTDGEPNIFPPSSFEDMLEKYKAKYPQFIFTLYTIALGKYLDSKLLSDLADIGGGQYSFIPCPGFMGTIFVNSFSNILTTMCNNAELTVKLDGDNKIVELVGLKDTKAKKSAKQARIPLGDIKYGQSRDIVIKVDVNKYLGSHQQFGTVSLKTWNWGTQSELITNTECYVQNATNQEKIQLKTQLSRSLLCDFIIDVYNTTPKHEENLSKSQNRMKELVNLIQQLQSEQEKLAEDEEDMDGPHNQQIDQMKGILKDANGEVSLSVLKPDFWRQWGRHFYPSVRNAHLKQVCNNFIDPGVQFYGGKMFKELRNQVEETFMKIPPPKPTKKKTYEEVKVQQSQQQQQQQQYAKKPRAQNQQQQQQQQVQQRPRSPSPVRMEDYYDCGGGGCFAGSCLIQTLSGQKRVDLLKKGDIVLNNNNGQYSKVIAILKISSKIPLLIIRIGQLLITPKHPVFIDGKWVKPMEVPHNTDQIEFCDSFYNLVLDKNHTAMIEGIMCTTLGHMIQGEKVEHPYFGTKAIIKDLEKIEGWNNGFIMIKNEQFTRNVVTGKVDGIVM